MEAKCLGMPVAARMGGSAEYLGGGEGVVELAGLDGL